MTEEPFDRLLRLLPPPAKEVVGVPWHLSRREIGIAFPAARTLPDRLRKLKPSRE